MGESAVMREVVDRPFKSPENVEVGRLGGERHGRGGERGLTIETGAPEDCAGQKVCEGFQIRFVPQSRAERCTLRKSSRMSEVAGRTKARTSSATQTYVSIASNNAGA